MSIRGVPDDDEEADSELASAARDRASEKYPFRTQVSINRGMSSRSRSLSCCSSTIRAFRRSFSTSSVRSRQPAALCSKPGKLVVINESKDDESELSDSVRAFVVP